MAHVLGIPSTREDIDGSMVRDVYSEENDLERILQNCEGVVAPAGQVFLRLRDVELLMEGEIVYLMHYFGSP